MAGIPDGLIVGGAATSRPVVLAAPYETVLRPRLGWRLSLGFVAFPMPFALVSQMARGTFEWVSLFVVVPFLVEAAAAWRKRVVLRGDELHQRGILTAYPVLRALEIKAITAGGERKETPDSESNYVVLRLWCSDGTNRGYMRFWWNHWGALAQWAAVYHTKSSPDGIPHWTIATDGETMRRLAPLLEATSPV